LRDSLCTHDFTANVNSSEELKEINNAFFSRCYEIGATGKLLITAVAIVVFFLGIVQINDLF
jgi:hypothetical protein